MHHASSQRVPRPSSRRLTAAAQAAIVASTLLLVACGEDRAKPNGSSSAGVGGGGGFEQAGGASSVGSSSATSTGSGGAGGEGAAGSGGSGGAPPPDCSGVASAPVTPTPMFQLPAQYAFWRDLAFDAQGRMVVHVGNGLAFVDSLGAVTPFVDLPLPPEFEVRAIDIAANGDVYVFSYPTIFRITPAAELEAWYELDAGSGSSGMRFAPNGDLVVLRDTYIQRIHPDKTVETVTPTSGGWSIASGAAALDNANGALYFADWGSPSRVLHVGAAGETLASVDLFEWSSPSGSVRGACDHLFVAEEGYLVRVTLDAAGAFVGQPEGMGQAPGIRWNHRFGKTGAGFSDKALYSVDLGGAVSEHAVGEAAAP
ncbi:MAG: hypothetical protein WKG00_27915 [Polyangiaceae bacterium]